MKRKVALFLACICASGALYSCGKQTSIEPKNEESKEETNKSSEDIDTAKADEANESISASAPKYAITSVAAEDYEYFTGSIECIQITDSEHPKLQEAVDDLFSGMVKTFNSSADSFNEDATEENKSNKEYANENPDIEYYENTYSNNISVEVIRSDAKVFSFIVDDYLYQGGAHGMTGETAYIFDAATGEQLTLSDFGDEATIKETAMNYIINTIDQSSQEAKDMLFQDDGIISGYEESIKEVFDGEVCPEYYIDNRGVVFLFQQYEIAPYAAGIIRFTVPYSEIEGFNEAYIPDDEFYSVQLSALGFNEYIDVDNDGTLDSFHATTISEDESEKYKHTIYLNDNSISEEYDGYVYATDYFIHTKTANYILTSAEGEAITLYLVSDGGLKQIDSIEPAGAIKEIKEDSIVIADRAYDVNGVSWGEEQTFKYSKKGLELK